MSVANKGFESVTCSVRGNLFSADLLRRILQGSASHQADSDHGRDPSSFTDESSTAFNVLRDAYARLTKLASGHGVSEDLVSEASHDFVKTLLVCLGYLPKRQATSLSLRVPDAPRASDAGACIREFPVTFMADEIPVVVCPALHSLDEIRPETSELSDGVTLKRSASMLMQSFLNASPEHSWGLVCNCGSARLMHSSSSVTDQAYVEFRLDEILSEGKYPEFRRMWRLLHAGRAARRDPQRFDSTIWDEWLKEDPASSDQASFRIRDNVSKAVEILGTGFMRSAGGDPLLYRLKSGELSARDYCHRLLRIIYRLMFLLCLEERDLLHPKDASRDAADRYRRAYSLRRFRDDSFRRKACRHGGHDAWESVVAVFSCLGREGGEPRLALPYLGGLFKAEQCPDLNDARLDNDALCAVMRLLLNVRSDSASSVTDYGHMSTEVPGSIYESLLEQIPVLDLEAKSFSFGSGIGNERKSTGSYYTPESLIRSLIKTALDPVIERTLAQCDGSPEEALLRIRVMDPACGSGHFLLAAARRLADVLAQQRCAAAVTDGSGNLWSTMSSTVSASEFAPDSSVGSSCAHACRIAENTEDGTGYERALRDVIRCCIYGVDINPMSVELTRMALWLEGFAENTPLSFLDHHVRCGNSLLGVFDVSVLKIGIPNEAYKAGALGDKAVCAGLARKNLKERRAIQSKKAGKFERASELMAPALDLETAGLGRSAAAFNVKDGLLRERLYAKFKKELDAGRLKQACDLYIAAYVSVKDADSEPLVPTSGDLIRILTEDPIPEDLARMTRHAAEICAEQKVFHWALEFPSEFADGGFDCVLGNPPWDKVQVEDVAWFETRRSEISCNRNTASRNRMISALGRGEFATEFLKQPHSEAVAAEERRLYKEYMTAVAQCLNLVCFCHAAEEEGGRYPLTGSGNMNLYSVFAELSLGLKKRSGTAGLILPSGIIGGKSNAAFAESVLKGGVSSVYHFDNTERLFPAVAVQYSFVLLTLDETSRSDYVFYASNIGHLGDQRRHISLTESDLELMSPNTMTLILASSGRDLEICRKIYKNAPVLVNERSGAEDANPWSVKFLQMFNMSHDSSLFMPWRDDAGLAPLYEGKLFSQFDHRHMSFYDGPDGDAGEVTREEKEDPSFRISPRYGVSPVRVRKRLEDRQWDREWMLAVRKISRSTDERTLIVSVLPATAGLGNSADALLPDVEPELAACLLAVLNSLTVDFVERIRQSGANLSSFYLKQLPVLPPCRFTEKERAYIVPRVAMLTRNAEDLNGVWLTDFDEYGYGDPGERLKIRSELDAYIARLYGLNREDLRYILDPAEVMGEEHPSSTFFRLKRNETELYGEYLTRRLVLEAFDALADADSD